MKRTYSVALTVLVSILMLASSAAIAQNPMDWTYLYDIAHTGVAADPIATPLSLSWRYATGESGDAVSTPAIGRDRVYFAYGSKLYAIDRATGAKSWPNEYTDLNTQVTSGLVLYHDTLYFGAADGKLWAVDAAGGTAKWKYASDGPVKSAPIIHAGIIYFGSDDGRLYAFDLSTDQPLAPFEASGPIQSTPAIWKDYILISSQDGYIYALRRTADGFQMVWRAQVTAAYMKLFSSPVIYRGQVLASADNRLIALDAQRGTRRWTFKAGDLITGSPAVRGRRAYIGSRDGVVYCIDTTRGSAIWRFPEDASRSPIQSSPVLAGDVLLVRSGDVQTTTPSRQTTTGWQPGVARGPGMGAATQAQRQTQTYPASIIALNPENGQLLWEYRLQQPLQPTTAPGGQFPGYGPQGTLMMRPGQPMGVLPGTAGLPRPGGMATGMAPGMATGMAPGMATSYTTVQDIYASYVDSSLACAQGSVYVLGDDGALYGFYAGATDNEKPVFKQTIITFPGAQADTQYSFAIPNESEELFFPPPAAEDLLQLPGAPPLHVATEVSDAGSGINPDSVQILIDGQPVPASQILYDVVQGMIWWIYDSGQVQAHNYPAGTHTLTVRASDWSGNQGGANVYFVIDNSLTEPKIPGMPQQPYGYGPGGLGTGYPGMPGGYGGPPGGPGGPYGPRPY